MAKVKGFLGRDYEMPEDRLYDGSRHLWLKKVAGGATVAVGVTAPGVALTGGLVELDVLAERGAEIVLDEEVAFATTRKAIKYMLSPVAGKVEEANVGLLAEAVDGDPYGSWLFTISAAPGWEGRLLDAAAYAAKLARSEHATDAASQAAKAGKGSPTCKSIYGGIKEG